jgi:hypothetical protein
MRRQWIGVALTVATLLLAAACARWATEPEAREAPAGPQENAVPQDPVPTTSGGYFGSGLKDEPPPKDTTGAT